MRVQAKELLDLEAKFRSGEGTEEDFERWKELAAVVLGRKDLGARKRRTFRIPTYGVCRIRQSGTSMSCFIREASRLNLTLSGDAIEHLQVGNRVIIDSIVTLGSDTQVALRGRVARLRLWDDEFAIGVELDMNVPAKGLDAYIESVYYPIYLKHLEEIASGISEESEVR